MRQGDTIEGPPAVEPGEFGRPAGGWRLKLYTVIFEADTRAGRRFDETLIVAILLSVAVVLLDSVASIAREHGAVLDALEWFFTLLFTAEYIARLSCVRRPARYARSFFGVVDLVAILPTYLAILFPPTHALIDVRILRLLRIFRIFKLSAYIGEYRLLGAAIAASRRKIMVFLSVVLMIVLIVGTLMYIIEGPAAGFSTIPTAVYWAIVTMTTVGYGDITPHTPLGRILASLMMLIGWGILAVPTGIVTAEMTAQRFGLKTPTTRTCRECLSEGHDTDAQYCKRCGAPLPERVRD
ncbi:MAG TPA: ion transporter [Burkholderiales bacterium]|jgi:Kef-type K+ transport systems, predicted NAD-binding component